MSRKRLILGCSAGIIAVYVLLSLLPKQYEVLESRSGVLVLWKGDNLFVLEDRRLTGRAENIVERKLREASEKSSAAIVLFLFMPHSMVPLDEAGLGYHISQGTVEPVNLPAGFNMYAWSILDGELVNRTPGSSWKWNGRSFIPLSAVQERVLMEQEEATSRKSVTLDVNAPGENEHFDGYKNLEAGGWHCKPLLPLDSQLHDVILPIVLGNRDHLTITMHRAGDDPTSTSTGRLEQWSRAGSVEITMQGHSSVLAPEMQGHFKQISKSEYQRLVSQSLSANSALKYFSYFSWMWVVFLLFVSLRFHWIFQILSIFGTKKRIANNLAEGYSMPPVVPEQFPALDRGSLEECSRQIEQLGFIRLGDYSLVPTSKALVIPVFVRLFAHSRYKCFAQAQQIFPPGKAPHPFGCAITAELENDWRITVSNRKPLPGAVFLRLPQSIARSFPGAPVSELMLKFVDFREKVCADLGVRPLSNDSLENFVRLQQKTAIQNREAVKSKSLSVGLVQYYKRKLGFGMNKQQYEWLGDYPKVAMSRKAGGSFTANSTERDLKTT